MIVHFVGLGSMRLVCPNCDAEYEVADDAIPDAGRDVQCSNCGHAWFQMSLLREAEDEATSAVFDPPPDFDVPQTALRTASNAARDTTLPVLSATIMPPAEPLAETLLPARAKAGLTIPGVPNQIMSDVILPGADHTDPIEPDPIEPDPVERDERAAIVPPAPRTIDDSVLAVLREEAEREIAARRNEAPARVETQTEMPIAPPQGAVAGPDQRGTARHIARMRGLEPDAADVVEPRPEVLRAPEPPLSDPQRPSARRDLLPDIEEINSTLRASNDRNDANRGATGRGNAATIPRTSGRDGFRSGFVLTLLVAVLLVVSYAMAPRIAVQFPQMSGALQGYVVAIDAARLWLDGAMRSVIGMLEG